MSDENNIPFENTPMTPQWEAMDAGIFTRFFATVKDILFHPVQFFKSFHADDDYKSPILYVLLLGIIIIILTFASISLTGDEQLNKILFSGPDSILFLFVLSSVSLLCIPPSLFVSAGIIHLLAILFGAASKPYKATFRIMAYLFTINLLGVIPFIGAPLAVICQAVYLTIALREVHHTTTFRAACVVLFPILLALLLFMWFLYAFFLPLSRGMFFSY